MKNPEEKWLMKNFEAVAAKYPGEWICVGPNGVIAHDKQLTKIFRNGGGLYHYVERPGTIRV